MDFDTILHESQDLCKNTIEIRPLYFICKVFSSCILWDKKEYIWKDTKYYHLYFVFLFFHEQGTKLLGFQSWKDDWYCSRRYIVSLYQVLYSWWFCGISRTNKPLILHLCWGWAFTWPHSNSQLTPALPLASTHTVSSWQPEELDIPETSVLYPSVIGSDLNSNKK